MSKTSMYRIVSPSEATEKPYPYVYVNEDRTVRELSESERKFLEDPFSPFDGGRPYVKVDYGSLNGWGSVKGYCRRSSIPSDLPISPAPAEDQKAPMSKEQRIEWLRKTMTGFEIIERPDGTIETRRRLLK